MSTPDPEAAPPTPEDRAMELTSPRKFHRVFTVPASSSPTHAPLRVSYSIAGPEEGDAPTILFVGGMFGTRWMAVGENWLAEKEGVRVLFVDRPGFGASTPVPIELRIRVFLDTIPLLLSHLNIPHVALLAAHSAGTIYALNLLCRRPDLLAPTSPRVTLFAPWVHQSISGVASLQAAALLPNPLLNHWDALIGTLLNSRIGDSAAARFSSSAGLLASAAHHLISGTPGPDPSPARSPAQKREAEERRCTEAFGCGMAQKKALDAQVMRCLFAESTKGGNDEARLCLKSVPRASWDAAESYPALVAALNRAHSAAAQNAEADGAVSRETLKVKLVFGETDAMIGVKGRRYFEECWAEEKVGAGIEVEVAEIKGGDHDSVVDPLLGVIGEMMRDAKGRR